MKVRKLAQLSQMQRRWVFVLLLFVCVCVFSSTTEFLSVTAVAVKNQAGLKDSPASASQTRC